MIRRHQYDCAHLLSTNAVPMPAEVVSVKHRIESLESRIASLKSQQQELEEELRQHRAVLSPVRQMPIEVLGEIFGHVFAPSCILDEHGRNRLVDLSLVCSRWRDAALCNRRLWSGVELIPDDFSFGKVVSWLARSGSTLKTLEGSLSTVGYHHICAEEGSICKSNSVALAKLLTDGPSLEHLNLRILTTQCLRNLVDVLRFHDVLAKPKARPWDSIKSLTLTVDNQWATDELEDADESILLHLPTSITSFHLHLPPACTIFFPDTDPTASFIPPSLLHRLTSLSLSWDWDDEYAYHVLLACHSHPIETLTLEVKSTSTFEDPGTLHDLAQIQLPQLRTLNLRILDPGANILRILQAPSLVSLSIQLFLDEYSDTPGESDFSLNVRSFIDNSKCQASFRSLSLGGDCIFEADDLASLLLPLSFLTHLKLDNIAFDDENQMFHHLRSPEPRMLPRLEVFELRQLPKNYDFYFVKKFLRSRWRFRRTQVPSPTGRLVKEYTFEGPPDSLKQVVVTYRNRGETPFKTKEDTPFINALRRQCGVMVSVSDCST